MKNSKENTEAESPVNLVFLSYKTRRETLRFLRYITTIFLIILYTIIYR